jgi:hypothetical protein
MTRTLTDAEAQVIGALLASTRVTERSRLQRAQVPRSTYHAARRRAYSEGWLRDRYIPNPVEYGLPFASISLARPFADRLAPNLAVRRQDVATVFLASSPQLVLSVGWHDTEHSARRTAEQPVTQGYAAWAFPLVVDLTAPSLPVYFDFEGTFAHLGGNATPEGYPQGLGGNAPTPVRAAGSPQERRSSWGISELVHRPIQEAGGGRAPHLVGPLGLPWGQQRLLNQGWASHRVLLDPARLPPFRGRSADQQVFVVGTLRESADAPGLFLALTRGCRVFPYLFASSERRILLGALGQTPGLAVVDPNQPPRTSVLQTLQAHLEGIEILQEPASHLQVNVDHRYELLFPRREEMG